LTYLRARDYAPGSGRFTTHDTIQPNLDGTQGYNPYAYAASNPVTFVDPGGHQAQPYPPPAWPIDDWMDEIGDAEVEIWEYIAPYGEDAFEVVQALREVGPAHKIWATGLAQAALRMSWGAYGALRMSFSLIGSLAGEAWSAAAIGGTAAWMFGVVALVLFVFAMAIALIARLTKCMSFYGIDGCSPEAIVVVAALFMTFGDGELVIDIVGEGIERDKKDKCRNPAEVWRDLSRKYGIPTGELSDRFHRIKKRRHGRATDDFCVTINGDVYDPEDDYAGNVIDDWM
jgi:hypothetical protein